MTTHVDYVDTQFENDDPLTLTVGGLYEDPINGRVHPRWIPRRKLELGDEVTFQILESETADEPTVEETYEPEDRAEQERKYYQFLKAKYEHTNENLRTVEYPEKISNLLDVATVWIDEAAAVAGRLNSENRAETMKHLGMALGSILLARSLNAPADSVVLASDDAEVPEPDGPMSPEQQARVNQLTEDEIQAIDQVLLAHASHQFRKVARVVGMTMGTSVHKKGIPDFFYAERIRRLVAEGKLESEGDLDYMRFSEVRIPE